MFFFYFCEAKFERIDRFTIVSFMSEARGTKYNNYESNTLLVVYGVRIGACLT